MIAAVVHPSTMVSSDAVRAFWTALAALHRPASLDVLVPHVTAAWQRARAAHPQLAVDETALMTFAGERIATSEPGAELERRHVEDLYLACGCARGDRAALATLEDETLPIVMRGLTKIAQSDDARRELIQMLREQMLVARDGAPGIAAYDGRAPLAIWLRVCAARLGMRQAAHDGRNQPLDDEHLDQLAPGVPDPQLAYLQQHYGAQFRAAFREAVTTLTPRERNLLRHSVIDGLSIDQIAAIYHVHRATAARQLKQTRETLIARTREQMRLALGIGETELDSIFRMLVSMADVTLREILRPQPRKTDG
ncbi:MAG TPA: sigma-70 family RNA polymerase sigma factor [Kofleriaceae bacterium]|nr:sigma-70 family RNA polymerase sigma factor [Kofleriaceae bacterium]